MPYLLDTAKEYQLNKFIQDSQNNWTSWHTLSPCSDWATLAWNSVADDLLSDRNSFWVSNPNTLADSIVSLKARLNDPLISFEGSTLESFIKGDNYIY